METPEETKMLQLIASQLKQFGYFTAAKSITDSIGIKAEPSNVLFELVQNANFGEQDVEDLRLIDDEELENDCLSFDLHARSTPVPNVSSIFSTQHRDGCRAAAFSIDGNYFATGSKDTSLKVLDTTLIRNKHSESGEEKKVFKTLYDHTQQVNEITFHPNGAVLASCSDDFNIKLYDLQKPNSKKAFRYLPDSYKVNSIAFHPSGEYMISGTEHHAVRLFDIQTMKVFIPQNTADHHNGAITRVRYAYNGSTFASSSIDGSIKIYDTVTGKCVNTIAKAHGGASVTSVQYSKSNNYLLSTGLDNKGILWDLGSGKQLQTYEGVSQTFDHAPMVFNFNERLIIGTDCATDFIIFWDSNTGEIMKRARGITDNPIRIIAASPVDMGFVTGSDDCRARYWNTRGQGME